MSSNSPTIRRVDMRVFVPAQNYDPITDKTQSASTLPVVGVGSRVHSLSNDTGKSINYTHGTDPSSQARYAQVREMIKLMNQEIRDSSQEPVMQPVIPNIPAFSLTQTTEASSSSSISSLTNNRLVESSMDEDALFAIEQWRNELVEEEETSSTSSLSTTTHSSSASSSSTSILSPQPRRPWEKRRWNPQEMAAFSQLLKNAKVDVDSDEE